ncbi:lipopolysaccharide transport periplasmic protein LptA [Dyella sp. 2HG41-7]|uniref:lipopolysaccharide transport periplasmic protein LptA n=1 Tax=Dyella sp. 2HG41-7 TaxID=2883239 RepID=UPI001F26A16B|nr:lipopolysaccharide transport periplasmic protein LptA [Dyella sp. 2HG41-7]
MLLQPALAKQDDRNQPIHVVHADSFDGYNQPNTISTFTGAVLITQGTMKLTGQVAKIYTAKEDTSVDHIIVTGTPQKRPHIEQIDDSGNLMTGDADQLYYDNVNGIAILTGNANVHQQNKGDAHGAKLTYNTQTSYMVGESSSSGQVTMTFLPKQKPLPPPKHGAPASTPATNAPAKPASSSSTKAPAPASSAPSKG